MNISPTIDLVELIVLVMGVIGLIISFIMVAFIQGDRNNLRIAKVNGINKRLANSDLRNELSRTYKLLGFTIAAIMAMTIPPPVNEGVRESFEWFKWMLISWEAVAMTNSLWALVDRIQNRGELKEIAIAKQKAQEKLAASLVAAEHNTAINIMNAAANVSDREANASNAAANAADAQANSEDAATNAAHAADMARRESEHS